MHSAQFGHIAKCNPKLELANMMYEKHTHTHKVQPANAMDWETVDEWRG